MATQDLPSKGMKAVLIRHVEKIVFGIVCLACLLLVAMSWMRETPNPGEPAKLSEAINMARMNVEDRTWDQADRDEDLSSNLETINNSEDDQIDYSWYSYDMPWHMPPFPPSAKRGDPDLYPVEQLTVTGSGYGAVAWTKGDAETDRGRGRPAARPGRGGRLDGLGGGDGDGEEQEVRQLAPEFRGQLPGFQGRPDVIPKAAYYVAITGVVPNARQYQAYEDTFGLAVDYAPSRDTPHWITYTIERADVTADPYGEVPESAWKRISHMAKVNGQAGLGSNDQDGEYWAQVMEEVVDPEHVFEEDNFTGPIPPIMLRDLSDAATHPLVPRMDPNAVDDDADEDADDDGEDDGDEVDTDEVDDDPLVPGITGAGDNESERDPSERDMRAERDPGDVNYKLFRFFDLTVEPGHTYRYRVQLYLEDPNNPRDAASAPPESSLQDTVAQRVRQNNAGDNRKIYRTSPYSEPTEPITIQVGRRIVAGPVAEPETERVRGGGNYPAPLNEEQFGEVLIIQWDGEVKVEDRTVPLDVMSVRKAVRGEVLQFTQDAEALDPTIQDFVPVEGYAFESEKVVLDMSGGEELPGLDRRDKPLSGGQILLLDENGNLEVHDSLLEENLFRQLQYIPEEPLEIEDEDLDDGGLGRGSGLPGVPARPRSRLDSD